MIELPSAFLDAMRRQLGDELAAFLRTYDQPAERGLRMNPLKRTELPQEDLIGCIPWEPEGRYIRSESRLGAIPLHEAGAYYLQDPSAMLPAAVLRAQPGELILDLCAAPGGKSTQLACAMQGKGLLVCNEPVPKRAQILSRNLERMGIPNALCVSAYPEQLARRWPDGFDAVLVDAPCSGEGMFRKYPGTIAEWTEDAPAGCARRQADILDSAAIMVRPGGRLVYSTCTMNRTENEETVSRFLDRHPDFHLTPFSLPGAEGPEGMLTCYPHRMRGEGQFAALLVRDGVGSAALPMDHSLPKADRETIRLLAGFAKEVPEVTGMLGDTVFSLPGCPDVKGLRVLRAGLHLGYRKGKVFEPDHAWAMSCCPPDVAQVPLTEAQAASYQAGETIPVPETVRGWILPTLNGLPLGWGKASSGVMKNHYPKGLRRTVSDPSMLSDIL